MPLMGSMQLMGSFWRHPIREGPVQNHRLYSDHSHATKCYNIEMTKSMSQIESLVRIPWISTRFFIHIYIIYVEGVKNWVFVAYSRQIVDTFENDTSEGPTSATKIRGIERQSMAVYRFDSSNETFSKVEEFIHGERRLKLLPFIF